MKPLALTLFDLDGTLLPLDTHQEWIRFLADTGRPDGQALLAGARAMDRRYHAGGDEVDVEFCEFFIRTLAELPEKTRHSLIARFVAERIVPVITGAARAEVDRARGLGPVGIITATNRLLTAPIAAEFGVAYLIATEVECVHGAPTGRLAGTPCMRAGKLECLARWLGQGHLTGVSARSDLALLSCYSDSINDRPLLEAADRAVAVDPDAPLAALARERGWPIVSWR